jgi:hypothetical protein
VLLKGISSDYVIPESRSDGNKSEKIKITELTQFLFESSNLLIDQIRLSNKTKSFPTFSNSQIPYFDLIAWAVFYSQKEQMIIEYKDSILKIFKFFISLSSDQKQPLMCLLQLQ